METNKAIVKLPEKTVALLNRTLPKPGPPKKVLEEDNYIEVNHVLRTSISTLNKRFLVVARQNHPARLLSGHSEAEGANRVPRSRRNARLGSIESHFGTIRHVEANARHEKIMTS